MKWTSLIAIAVMLSSAGGAPILARDAAPARAEKENAFFDQDIVIVMDASKGYSYPLPMTVHETRRGEMALMVRTEVKESGKIAVVDNYRDRAKNMRFRHATLDPGNGSKPAVFQMEGVVQMSWTATADNGAERYNLIGDVVRNVELQALLLADDKVGDLRDMRMSQTVILPNGGKGFTITGENYDITIAGLRFTRTVTMDNGRVTTVTTRRQIRRLTREDLLIAQPDIDRLKETDAFIVAPLNALWSEEEKALLLSEEPLTPYGYVMRGIVRDWNNDTDGAAADFRTAHEQDPEMTDAPLRLSLIVLEKGDVEEAEKLLSGFEGGEGAGYLTNLALGQLALKKGKLQEALALLTESIEEQADSSSSYASRAQANMRLGNFQAMLRDTERAVEIQPQFWSGWNDLARFRTAASDRAGALAAIDKLVEIAPDALDSWVMRTAVFKDLGNRAEAEKSAEKLFALIETQDTNKEWDEFDSARTIYMIYLGRAPEALALLDKGIAAKPDDFDLYNQRCLARAVANVALDQALRDCDRSIALSPGSGEVYDSRAYVKFQQGRYADAIADLDKALSLNPDLAESLYMRGEAKRKIGDIKGATADLDAALKTDYAAPFTLRTYGYKAAP